MTSYNLRGEDQILLAAFSHSNKTPRLAPQNTIGQHLHLSWQTLGRPWNWSQLVTLAHAASRRDDNGFEGSESIHPGTNP
jgi:hypothetical protein